ncbi:hypothetical protein FRC06_001316 [Ceratobasidium sp. 370]|nr:hypothetical protein FRC06_001316 [Ceratobasidium sp. 370]
MQITALRTLSDGHTPIPQRKTFGMVWSFIRRGWKTLKRGYTDIRNTIEESFISLKNDLRRCKDWFSQPDEYTLSIAPACYTVFTVIFCGTLVLVLGPQGAAIAGSCVLAWKLAEKLAEHFGLAEKLAKYFGFVPPKGRFWRWAWLGVQLLALGPSGILWFVAEWCADRVSEGVQKVMEWFGAEFKAPKLD